MYCIIYFIQEVEDSSLERDTKEKDKPEEPVKKLATRSEPFSFEDGGY